MKLEEFALSATPLRPDLAPAAQPIVFFDGVCGLCNRFVDFLLRVDRRQQLVFATLQGETARRLLGTVDANDLKSVVFVQGKVIRQRSDAVAAILKLLDWPWRGAGYGLKLLPPFLRDFGYELVAQNRYRLFGKKATCRLPTPAERRRFLA